MIPIMGIDTLAGSLGCYVGASVSCRTWWSLLWVAFRVQCNEKCCCGNVQYVFGGENEYVHLI